MTALLRRAGLLVPPVLGAAAEFARREALTTPGSSTYWNTGVQPDTSNTGLLSSLMTTINGDVTLSTAGQVLQDTIVNGSVIVSANGCTVRNCYVRGGATAPTSQSALILVRDYSRAATITDCLLDPQVPSEFWDGIRTCGFTAKRVRIRRVTDGFGVFPTTGSGTTAPGNPNNVQVLGCMVESMTKWYPDSSHSDGTHNDCIQIQGGVGVDNVIVRGCRLMSYFDPGSGNTAGLNTETGGAATSPNCTQGNAVVQLNRNVGECSGLRIENNWMGGGKIAVNGTAITTSVDLGYVINNKFDRGQYLDVANQGTDTSQTLRIAPTPTCVTTGNVYEDTGNAVLVRRST